MEGVVFKSPDITRDGEQSTIGFVYDNNNCSTGKVGMKIEEKLKASAQKWEHASDGKLELNECFTYMVKWEHNRGGKQSIRKVRERLEI